MFDLIEKKIAERDILVSQYKPVRHYFEDVLSSIPTAHKNNEHGESVWSYEFPEFEFKGRQFEIIAETLPTKKDLHDTEIRLRLWAKNFQDEAVEEWLPTLENLSDKTNLRNNLTTIIGDLERIVHRLELKIHPGYLG